MCNLFNAYLDTFTMVGFTMDGLLVVQQNEYNSSNCHSSKHRVNIYFYLLSQNVNAIILCV